MADLHHGLQYHNLDVKESDSNTATIHYIEAGNPTTPHLVLLHGFPSSSNSFRDLIPLLSDKYHILAPDYPGFGLTKTPSGFEYTFSNISSIIASWLAALGIKKTAIYGHAYGGPVALRMALAEKIEYSAFIIQNGNIYNEGLNHDFWCPIMQLWKTKTSTAEFRETRTAISQALFNIEAAKSLYQGGTPDADLVLLDPSAWTIDYLQNLSEEENQSHQLDLLYDFRTNVALYPEFQTYLQVNARSLPVLVLFGANDPAFTTEAASLVKEHSPDAIVKLLDAGHFALETKRWEMAEVIRNFLADNGW